MQIDSMHWKLTFLIVLCCSLLGCSQFQDDKNSSSENSGTSSAHAPTLSGLVLSSGTLDPDFSPDIQEYTATTSFLSLNLQITASNETGASIAINSAPATSGEPSSNITLSEGENLINVVVYTRTEYRTYTLRITRNTIDENTGFQYRHYLKSTTATSNENFGSSVAGDGNTFIVGAQHEYSGITGDPTDKNSPDAGAAFIYQYESNFWNQTAYLKADNIDNSDEFGFSVAISGNTVAIGVPREDSNATGINGDSSNNAVANSGAVYIFVKDSGNWVKQAYIKASNPDSNDLFGFSVALSGDVLIVGAPKESSQAVGINGNEFDNSKSSSGAVYIFRRSGTTWTQEAYVKAPNPDINDEFGHSVAIDNEIIVIGAHREQSFSREVNGNLFDNGGTDVGATYVYEYINSTWKNTGYLKAPNAEGFDLFGHSVAISGTTIAVGAKDEASSATGINGDGNDNSASGAGAVYIFERSGTSWAFSNYLKASNAGGGDRFGVAIDLHGDLLLVGANEESGSAVNINGNATDDSSSFSGAAYLFIRSASGWKERAYIKASNTEASDNFGTGVALSSDHVMIGARYEDSSGSLQDNSANESGAAYSYH